MGRVEAPDREQDLEGDVAAGCLDHPYPVQVVVDPLTGYLHVLSPHQIDLVEHDQIGEPDLAQLQHVQGLVVTVLELTPEVHYGAFKSRTRGSDGVFIRTQQRDKKIFEELKLEPALAAGQMLLITCRPDRSGTAGWHFFTDTTGDKPVAMLWVLRVARAAPDRAFYDGPPKDEPGPVSNDQDD